MALNRSAINSRGINGRTRLGSYSGTIMTLRQRVGAYNAAQSIMVLQQIVELRSTYSGSIMTLRQVVNKRYSNLSIMKLHQHVEE